MLRRREVGFSPFRPPPQRMEKTEFLPRTPIFMTTTFSVCLIALAPLGGLRVTFGLLKGSALWELLFCPGP